MSSLGNSSTSFNATKDLRYISADGATVSLPQMNELWKPKIISQSPAKAVSLPLGGVFLVVFLTLCAVSFILLCITLFSPIPFFSVKFTVFLILFFGGFAGELIFARKMKKNESAN